MPLPSINVESQIILINSISIFLFLIALSTLIDNLIFSFHIYVMNISACYLTKSYNLMSFLWKHSSNYRHFFYFVLELPKPPISSSNYPKPTCLIPALTPSTFSVQKHSKWDFHPPMWRQNSTSIPPYLPNIFGEQNRWVSLHWFWF